MAKKIAIFNHKGGVSKTTTSFNLEKADNWVRRIKSAKPNYFVHWGLLRA